MNNIKPIRNSWCTYILLCKDNTLYTGITNNIENRFIKHAAGNGAKYTKAHGVKKLVYLRTHIDRSDAAKHESIIKRMTRQDKLELIKTTAKINLPSNIS